MKKILLVMAILLIATPTWAGLTITATSPDCNTVQIYYDMDVSDPNLPRAFALEISLDNDANIGPVTYVDPNFHVYPGSIVITGGVVTDQGTPVAESDVNSMIVEMGSLYAADDPCHTSPPAENSTLLIFKVQNDKDCNVSLAQNAIRGGVVMEDTTQEFSPSYVTLTGCHVDGCDGCNFPSDHPDYSAWLARSSPPSWCNPRQCHGDADGLMETRGKNDFWVGYPDLDLFLDGFPITTLTYVDEATHPWIAADFDHDIETRGKNNFYIGYPDLDIFLANFPIPGVDGIDPNCLDVP
jgi:hypothetical protein